METDVISWWLSEGCYCLEACRLIRPRLLQVMLPKKIVEAISAVTIDAANGLETRGAIGYAAGHEKMVEFRRLVIVRM